MTLSAQGSKRVVATASLFRNQSTFTLAEERETDVDLPRYVIDRLVDEVARRLDATGAHKPVDQHERLVGRVTISLEVLAYPLPEGSPDTPEHRSWFRRIMRGINPLRYGDPIQLDIPIELEPQESNHV